MNRNVITLAGFLAILALLMCFNTSALAKDSKKYKYTWKFATLAPDGMGWSKHMKDVVFPVMEEFTRGELLVKVYWGGVMGDEEDYIRKIHIGQLQGAGLSAQGTVMACPEMSVLELPFLFQNYYEVDYVRLKMDRYFDDLFRRKNLFLIGWIDQDFDQIYSMKYPMNTVEDFSKSRFVSWYGPIEEVMLEALDADIVSVNVPEVGAAVGQGLVDAAIGPAIMIIATQAHSKVKYTNPVKIRYSPATMVQTMDSLMELPEEYRKDFYFQRLKLGFRYCNLVRIDNEKYFNSLVKYGVKKTEMSPEQLALLQEKTKAIWKSQKLLGRLYSQELLDEVLAHVADYRAGKRLTREDLYQFARLNPATITPEEKKYLEELTKDGLREFGLDDGKLVTLD